MGSLRSIALAVLLTGGMTACALPDVQLPDVRLPGAPFAAAPTTEPAVPTVMPFASAATPISRPRETAVPLPQVAPVPTLPAALTSPLEQEQQLLIELYRRVNPAVVSIEVAGKHPAAEGAPSSDTVIPFAEGSGFLIDDQGHIVTNHHVVEGASEYQVRFAEGTIVEAQLIGSDAAADLAVLKVDQLPEGVAPLSLADSQGVAVGQTAVAIGNPFGLQNTLTVGVISAIGRTLRGSEQNRYSLPNLLQTDAAINPGNSGGPLLDIHGQVVGVNTAISSNSGQFEGVGYAIPSNMVGRVVPALISDGAYKHPWLGIAMSDVDPLAARQLSLAATQGVLITDVVAGSPAAQAGLRAGSETDARAGDIVTAIDETAVRSGDELVGFLEMQQIGSTVTLTVLRDGQTERVPVTLAERPAN